MKTYFLETLLNVVNCESVEDLRAKMLAGHVTKAMLFRAKGMGTKHYNMLLEFLSIREQPVEYKDLRN